MTKIIAIITIVTAASIVLASCENAKGGQRPLRLVPAITLSTR